VLAVVIRSLFAYLMPYIYLYDVVDTELKIQKTKVVLKLLARAQMPPPISLGLVFSASKKSKSARISASKKLQRGKNLKKYQKTTKSHLNAPKKIIKIAPKNRKMRKIPALHIIFLSYENKREGGEKVVVVFFSAREHVCVPLPSSDTAKSAADACV
jgi:hypothetical protein